MDSIKKQLTDTQKLTAKFADGIANAADFGTAGRNCAVRIESIWLGTRVLDDGSFSDLLEDGYFALEHADWMDLRDGDGWPRATKPGDIFWESFPVIGAAITLHNGCLVADNGQTKVTLKEVDASSVLQTGDPLVASIIGMLFPPPDQSEVGSLSESSGIGLTGSFGQGGRQ